MTLEFAKTEAERRTAALNTTHYVVKSQMSHVDYMVMTRVPPGYTSVATYPAPSPFAVITIMYQPGVGTQRKVSTREELDAFIDECIKNNTPFHVGHEFGNIDGTHPKR